MAELAQLGMIHSKKSANEVLYWKAVAQPVKEWYSVDDVAKYLSVSKRTAQQLIRDGEVVGLPSWTRRAPTNTPYGPGRSDAPRRQRRFSGIGRAGRLGAV